MFNTVRGAEILLGKNECWSGANCDVLLTAKKKEILFHDLGVFGTKGCYEKLIVVSNKVTE